MFCRNNHIYSELRWIRSATYSDSWYTSFLYISELMLSIPEALLVFKLIIHSVVVKGDKKNVLSFLGRFQGAFN